MFTLPLISISTISRIFIRKMTTSQDSIIVDKIGQITTIGINRPSKRNCINLNTANLIKNAIEEFEHDNNAYAAVLYGTGGNFCSGFDFNEVAQFENTLESTNILQHGLTGISRYVEKPIVAAINGYAVAGGFELALFCDLRIMEDTAVMGFYGRRFGIPLTDGTIVRLQAMIGLSRALDMVLTGRSLNAKEAFEWGVANRIVACGTSLGQAIQVASSLVKFPQESLRLDRTSTYNAAFSTAHEDLQKSQQKSSKQAILKEGLINGAKKFLSGLGKHGKTYNLSPRTTFDWEKEFQENLGSKPKSKL